MAPGIDELRDGRDDPCFHRNSCGVFQSKPLRGGRHADSAPQPVTLIILRIRKSLGTLETLETCLSIPAKHTFTLGNIGQVLPTLSLSLSVFAIGLWTMMDYSGLLGSKKAEIHTSSRSLEVKILTDTPGHVYVGEDRG